MGNVATFGLYYGTQLLIGAFSSKKRPDVTRTADFGPSSVASQGAWLPLLVGERRLGPVVAWVGDRSANPVTVRVNTKGSKKKTKQTGEINYAEAGWHLLCVGPAEQLHKIYENGKVIYEGPIDSVTTPSGSELTTTSGDTFVVYWGEVDQDVNTFLSDVSRVGVASRWPYCCYVQWTSKNLGPSPHWPLLEYHIEARGSGLVADPAEVSHAVVDQAGPTYAIDLSSNVVIATAGWYRIKDDAASNFVYLRRTKAHPDAAKISNPTWADVVVTFNGATLLSDAGPLTSESSAPATWTHEELDPGTPGVTLASLTQYFTYGPVYLTAGNYAFRFRVNVSNIAVGDSWAAQSDILLEHLPADSIGGALLQILFSPFPHGLGLDDDLFDLTSVATIDQALVDEGVTLSVYARDGEEAIATLGGIMSDHGVVLYRSPTTGLLTFALVREETPAEVPEELVADQLPEVEVVHEEKTATRLVYEFSDVDREFRETTIAVDEDGAADRLAHHRARKILLPTVIDADTAAVVTERRSQEEFGGATSYRILLNRGALALRPGQAVSVEGFDDVLRVTSIAPKGASEVELVGIPDHFGSAASTYGTAAGGGVSLSGTPVAADEQYTILEVPAHLLEGGPPQVLIPRVRAHDQIAYSTIHFSADGTTYTAIGTEFEIGTGGQLLEGIAADSAWEITTGPTLEILGPPDDDVIDDLSSDELNWRLGRQLALIGGEIFFLKKLTAVSGTTYRLDGLIRARFDTQRAAHAIGAEVYLFRADEITGFGDSLLMPGQTLYVKSQPSASTALALGSVTAETATLVGKGIVPMVPCALRVTAPRKGVQAFYTGEDVSLDWAYRSTATPKTGAGMQPAGDAVGDSAVQGSFELRFLTTGDVLKKTVTQATTGYTLTNADLVADFGSEQPFKVQLRNVNGGYRSAAISFTVTLL